MGGGYPQYITIHSNQPFLFVKNISTFSKPTPKRDPPEGSSHYVHKDKPSPLCKNLPGTSRKFLQFVQGSNLGNWPRFVCFSSPESAIPTSGTRATNLMIDSLCTHYELFPLDLSLRLKKPSKNSATLLCLRGLFLEECPRVFVRYFTGIFRKKNGNCKSCLPNTAPT